MTELTQSLMESMAYETFVTIISDIPSCIFFKDTELRYQFSSHCWQQLISDDIIGKTDLEIRKDKDNAMLAMAADRNILNTGKGSSYVIKSDIDGEISYLQLIKEPVFDKDGNIIGIVGLINDVTEKTLLEKELRQMSNELNEHNIDLQSSNIELQNLLSELERKSQAEIMYTASMNHELRSPLNGIIGILQILLEDNNLTSSQRNYVDNAYQSSKMLLEIVNDLLDLAKMETNEFSINAAEFNLCDMVDGVATQAVKSCENKGLSFNTIIAPDLKKYYVADELRVRQILYNIVSNAVKYTDCGSVTLSVSYDVGNIVFKCSDTGQGISSEEMQVLFDPFVRLKEEKNAHIKGTGLGLFIVKRIIDKMGGVINVDSEVNVGTTFTIRIPATIGSEVNASSNTSDKDIAIVDNTDFSNYKVLCVDDNTVNHIVFKGLLKNTNIMIDDAYLGPEAIDMSNKIKYDIIFMDHQMPDMDGIEAFKIIRSECNLNATTPVIVLTGNAGAIYEEEYNKAGFDGYLAKPVLKEQLIKIIAENIAR